jgi:hypothetical protein
VATQIRRARARAKLLTDEQYDRYIGVVQAFDAPTKKASGFDADQNPGKPEI